MLLHDVKCAGHTAILFLVLPNKGRGVKVLEQAASPEERAELRLVLAEWLHATERGQR